MADGHGAGSIRRRLKIGLSGALCLAVLGGCATGGGTPAGDQRSAERREILTGLAVEVATIRLVEARPEMGARVAALAMMAAQAIGSGDALTVAAAKAAIERRVGWGQLMPTEQLLAQTLIDLVAADLAAAAPNGFTDPESRVAAAALLERIAGAAALASGWAPAELKT